MFYCIKYIGYLLRGTLLHVKWSVNIMYMYKPNSGPDRLVI